MFLVENSRMDFETAERGTIGKNSKTSSSSPALPKYLELGKQHGSSLVCAYAGLKTTAPYSRPEPTLSRGSYVFFSIGVRLLFTLNRSGMENSA